MEQKTGSIQTAYTTNRLLCAFREQFDKAWLDHLAHSVQREDFEAKTLHVFRMARAGLIYLSLGMHAEERRPAAAEPKGPLAAMELPPFDENRRI